MPQPYENRARGQWRAFEFALKEIEIDQSLRVELHSADPPQMLLRHVGGRLVFAAEAEWKRIDFAVDTDQR